MKAFPPSASRNFILALLLTHGLLMAARPAGAASQISPSSTNKSAPRHSLPPNALFQRVSPSVFLVEALRSDGKVLSQGSGVVVAREGVVTNRHVVEEATGIRVRHGKKTWVATIAYLDPEHDLCQLRVLGLPAPPVPIRRSSSLQIGERVYAIGAPEGLELTLSEGLISSLRPYEKVMLIQTTAPVSSGSSGGGLFDPQGRLIGITTFGVKEGQNLNFALPGEWIVALATQPAGPPIARSRVPALEDAVAWFYVGFDAANAKDWTKAIRAYREAIRLKPDFADAWRWMGSAYHDQHQYADAIAAYREAIRLKPDDVSVWHVLGIAHYSHGDTAEAIAAFHEAIRLKPDDPDGWSGLGDVYRWGGEYAQAIKAYREAIRIKPDDADAWVSLGMVYERQDQYAEAFAAYREATRLKPGDPEGWAGLGNVYRSRGEYAEAITA